MEKIAISARHNRSPPFVPLDSAGDCRTRCSEKPFKIPLLRSFKKCGRPWESARTKADRLGPGEGQFHGFPRFPANGGLPARLHRTSATLSLIEELFCRGVERTADQRLHLERMSPAAGLAARSPARTANPRTRRREPSTWPYWLGARKCRISPVRKRLTRTGVPQWLGFRGPFFQ
jgi:hypothetical protein